MLRLNIYIFLSQNNRDIDEFRSLTFEHQILIKTMFL